MARVLLLFGGRSAEHEVSCVSAVAILEALQGAGHEVIPVGIDRAGGWHLADGSLRPLQAGGPGAELVIPQGTIRASGRVIDSDVAFPVLHGPYGEDGTIQGAFEMAGVPYVGAGVRASALGMEKDFAKRLFRHGGLPTAAYTTMRRPEWDGGSGAVVDRVIAELGLPLFIKPAALGSSVGVSRATTEEEVKQGLEDAFGHGDKVIVEESVAAREIEVAVLEGPRVSVPGEIVLVSGWYDYDAKYVDDTSRFVAPAELSAADTARVRHLAGKAFEILELQGLARVDFLFEEGGRGFLLNEVNTMPGFTPISGFPKMWEASGMSYPELCDELVRLALAGAGRLRA